MSTRSLEVTKLHIDSDVQCRFATTAINSHVKNHSKQVQETTFIAVLPDAAFIIHFEMEIDGKVTTDDVKEKEMAKQEYLVAKERGATGSHIEKASSEMNAFYVAVNVAAEGSVRFKLVYQELLQRSHGVYTHQINISPQQPVSDLQVTVAISDSTPITILHVPVFAAQLSDKSAKDLLLMEKAEDVLITKETPSDCRFLWQLSTEEQMNKYADEEGIVYGQLIILYDVEHKNDQVLVVDNHFIHFFAPSDLAVGTKNIVFALDTSWSMLFRKLELAKMAMRVILGQLSPNDRFGILCFDSSRGVRKMPSVMVTAANVAEAIDFIDVHTTGSSDLDQAMQEAISWLKDDEASGHQKEHLASIVILLTDGLHNPPPDGFSTDQIVPRVLQNRHPKTKICCLAFGIDANFSLLRQLAVNTGGFARRIFEDTPDAPIDEGQFKAFYDEIASPLLVDMKIKYLSPVVEVASVVQNTDTDTLYKGSECVLIGQLDAVKELKEGDQLFEWTARDSRGLVNYVCCYQPWTRKNPDAKCAIPGTAGGFIERSWAYLSVKTLLEKAEVELEVAKAKGMRAEALKLALKYKFVTDLTSMVLVQKTGKSTKREDDIKANIKRVEKIVEDMEDEGVPYFDVWGQFGCRMSCEQPDYDCHYDDDEIRVKVAVPRVDVTFIGKLVAINQNDLIVALEKHLELVNVTVEGDRDMRLLALLEQLIVKRFPAMGTGDQGMIAQLFNALNPLHIVKNGDDGDLWDVYSGKQLDSVAIASLLEAVQLLIRTMREERDKFASMASENPLLALLAVEVGDSAARASDLGTLASDVLALVGVHVPVDNKKSDDSEDAEASHQSHPCKGFKAGVSHCIINKLASLSTGQIDPLIAALEKLPELANVTVEGEGVMRLLALLGQLILKRFCDDIDADDLRDEEKDKMAKLFSKGMVAPLFNAKKPVHIVKMDGDRWAVHYCKDEDRPGETEVVGEVESLITAIQLLINTMLEHGDECDEMMGKNPALTLLGVNVGDDADEKIEATKLARDVVAIIDGVLVMDEKKDDVTAKSKTVTGGSCSCS